MGDWGSASGVSGAFGVSGASRSSGASGASGAQGWPLAETLGVAMARRAADILSRHRAALTGTALTRAEPDADRAESTADDAIFTAVLNAANECLGRFDGRPADDRWCDALLCLLRLAELDTGT